MDNLDKDTRTSLMSKIRRKNTKPEIIVKSIIFKLGYRYKLNNAKLPGSPDIVLSKYRKLIFVNGCFWHSHSCCKRSTRPKTNIDFWNRKLDNNVERDNYNYELLKKAGWDILVVWQCQTKNIDLLTQIITEFLEKPNHEK